MESILLQRGEVEMQSVVGSLGQEGQASPAPDWNTVCQRHKAKPRLESQIKVDTQETSRRGWAVGWTGMGDERGLLWGERCGSRGAREPHTRHSP